MGDSVSDFEELKFSAEVGKVLSLVINSLYTNKEIFLREVISNASDACDKLRHGFLLNHDLMEEGDELKVVISVDKDKGELVIYDNGIGMDRKDLIENLGVIAGSGTQRFLEEMQGKRAGGGELIGKFGVGFYSVFMVAKEVVVDSCKAGQKVGYRWSSSGDGGFSVAKLDGETPRGTRVVLLLRPEESEFLDKFRLEHIVTTYSDYVGYPIYFLNDKGEEEKLNSGEAIWSRAKGDVSPEEHLNFFRSVGHIGGDPWMTLHNKSEGVVEYVNLLYVPSIKPFDLFHPDRRCSVKLYVNRVFITEDNVKVVPQYLRFLRGVIDSSDLPLNISRETLQNNRVVEKIRSSVVKKVLSALKERAEADAEDYAKFWDNFGPVLKEGLCESMDTESVERLLAICRFHSTEGDGKLVSLDDYIARMKPEQGSIFYVSGDDLESVRRSPQIEGFVGKGVEVLLLVDPVDDFWTSVVTGYKGVSLKSVTRVGSEDLEKFADGGAKEEHGKEGEEDTKSEGVDALVAYLKKTLGGEVSDVRVSKKLTSSLVCLAVPETSMDIRMERFLREQRQLSYKSTKILEVNVKHPVLKSMLDEYKANGESELLENMAYLLFGQACIVEGEGVGNAVDFAARMNYALARCFTVTKQ